MKELNKFPFVNKRVQKINLASSFTRNSLKIWLINPNKILIRSLLSCLLHWLSLRHQLFHFSDLLTLFRHFYSISFLQDKIPLEPWINHQISHCKFLPHHIRSYYLLLKLQGSYPHFFLYFCLLFLLFFSHPFGCIKGSDKLSSCVFNKPPHF